jgi:hypothetical protein
MSTNYPNTLLTGGIMGEVLSTNFLLVNKLFLTLLTPNSLIINTLYQCQQCQQSIYSEVLIWGVNVNCMLWSVHIYT